MPPKRNLMILLDRASGLTLEECAAKYGVNKQRVHQIQNATLLRLFIRRPKRFEQVSLAEIGLAIQRLEAARTEQYDPNTPQAFHAELVREREEDERNLYYQGEL